MVRCLAFCIGCGCGHVGNASSALSTCPQPDCRWTAAVGEEAMELSAGGVGGALLIFGGAVGDQRAAFTIESRKHDVIHRPFSQPKGGLEGADRLSAMPPPVLAVLTP